MPRDLAPATELADRDLEFVAAGLIKATGPLVVPEPFPVFLDRPTGPRSGRSTLPPPQSGTGAGLEQLPPPRSN